MPASPSHVPAYRHYKPKDLGVVRIDGRDHYLGKYGSADSWEKYHRLLAERFRDKSSLPVNPRNDPEPLTITEVCVRYYSWAIEFYRKNGKPTGQAEIIRRALRTFRGLFGSTIGRDFGPLNLKTVQAAFIKEGLCRNEVNRRVSLIKQMFKWAVSEELVPPAVFQGVSTVRNLAKGRTAAPDHEPVGPVPDAIVERTLEHLSPTVAAMVRLQLATGMRPGELVAMRPCDLAMTGDVWEYRPGSHKSEHKDRDRVVMIGPRAQAVLRPFLGLDLTAPVFSPKRAMEAQAAERRAARKTPLWPSHVRGQAARKRTRGPRKPGDAYSVESYRNAVYRACDQANPHPTLDRVPVVKMTAEQKAEFTAWRNDHRWHPNRLRHSAATTIRQQFGIEVSRAVLGHSDSDTTAIYAERDLTAAREAASRLG